MDLTENGYLLKIFDLANMKKIFFFVLGNVLQKIFYFFESKKLILNYYTNLLTLNKCLTNKSKLRSLLLTIKFELNEEKGEMGVIIVAILTVLVRVLVLLQGKVVDILILRFKAIMNGAI